MRSGRLDDEEQLEFEEVKFRGSQNQSRVDSCKQQEDYPQCKFKDIPNSPFTIVDDAPLRRRDEKSASKHRDRSNDSDEFEQRRVVSHKDTS